MEESNNAYSHPDVSKQPNILLFQFCSLGNLINFKNAVHSSVEFISRNLCCTFV